MRNRAKCKLCQSIIESFLPDEIVYCKCGEVAVCDGAAMRMWPIGSPNFLRIDDLGNEIVVRYEEKETEGDNDKEPNQPNTPRTRADLIKDLENSLDYDDSSPDHEKYSPCSNAALSHYVRAIVNILKRDE